MITNLGSEVKKIKLHFRCIILNKLWNLTELNFLICKLGKNNTYLIGFFRELNEVMHACL